MHKPTRSLIKILDNPDRQHTSLKRAGEFVQRGFAEWVELDISIRFKKSSQVRQEIQADADRRYWNSLARQRGGVSDLFCMWAARPSGGYTVMQAHVGVEAK